MRFTEVNEVPLPKRTYHRLKDDLERFVQSKMAIAKIEFHEGEYANTKSASNCLQQAIKRHHFAGIKVIQRGDNLYLENNNL